MIAPWEGAVLGFFITLRLGYRSEAKQKVRAEK
jgi:hypothetical protein